VIPNLFVYAASLVMVSAEGHSPSLLTGDMVLPIHMEEAAGRHSYPLPEEHRLGLH
jgi:hypothetical protein